MAVYRVNKNRGYTVMANFHLRDKSLSLKAVGLLSKMLSFNDGWKFSTKGLSAICKEGPDAILSALRELEKHGYLVRHRQRDGKGRMSSTIFEIYEEPQESTPEREIPHTENPCVEKPDVDNPRGDKSAQINTDQVITQERNTLSKNYQSINLDGMDRMDERSEYEEIIKENLDYDILCQDPKFDKDRFREIMDIMLDAVCSTAPTIRINGEDMPQQADERRAQQDAREQQLAQERQARYDSAIREAEGNIMAGKEVINREINGKSLIMQLFREHEIPVPLKTQGWIINSLHSIRYDPKIGEWNYRYFKGSRNSTKMFDLLSKLSAAIQTRQQFEEHGASPPDSPVLDCEEEQDMEL